MKISEFKQYIKETIVDVLSEESVKPEDAGQYAKNMEAAASAAERLQKALSEDVDDDAEPSKAELKKTKSLAKAKEELAQLTKKMKTKAKDYKSAEGKEKDNIKDELKKMTAEKKKLEKSIQ